MNKDVFDDIFRHLRRDQKTSSSSDLVNGLKDRQYGQNKQNCKGKHNVELFAEHELIRKQEYGEMRCEMPGLPRSTFLMVFSADGTKVASTHGNHNIYISDIRSGKNIKTLIGHPRTPWCIAFHPTCNQIVASGCLGGQVRIWDLSGGSEVWTAGSTTVIASIAFHPNDRVLVIATYNEVYFWDWSKPEPFVHISTRNPKEKVRYVAFDKLGHKLITGIANSPQTRWERVRAPVPVPRQVERSASPYRRRITPRLVNFQNTQPSTSESTREPISGVPERERRITMCYRNLVREYEQLVQRYLQLYRPPTMIDRGTDPMEFNPRSTSSGTQTLGPNEATISVDSSGPSTSRDQPQSSTSDTLITPSMMFSKAKPKKSLFVRGTQTSESRKHKADNTKDDKRKKRVKRVTTEVPCRLSSVIQGGSANPPPSSVSSQQLDVGTQTQCPRKVLVINDSEKPTTSSNSEVLNQPTTSRYGTFEESIDNNQSTSGGISENNGNNLYESNVDELLTSIRRTAEEEVRNRILPIIRSVPANDRPELIRLFENSRERVRMKYRQMCSTKKKGRPNVPSSSSNDSCSDSDERISENLRNFNRLLQENLETTSNQPQTCSTSNITTTNPVTSTANQRNSSGNINTELEQLVTTVLTEMKRNATARGTGNDGQSSSWTVVTPPANVTANATTTGLSSRPTSSISDSCTSTEQSTSDNAAGPGLFLDSNERAEEQESPAIAAVTTTTTTATTTSTTSTFTLSPRRRFFSHRVSAFMPTRVNYTRSPTRLRRNSHMWGRTRMGARFFGGNVLDLDEIINYSERAHSEDDPPQDNQPFPNVNSFDAPREFSSNNPENIGIGNMYSNIVEDLESSLNDVRSIRASNRPGETSDMLNSFSERLENIMNQSDTILRNLRSSMDMLNSSTELNSNLPQNSNESSFFDPISQNSNEPSLNLFDPISQNTNEPSLSFFDQNFFVREQRNDDLEFGSYRNSLFNRPPFSAIASDHTYPRNPDNPSTSTTENMSPLMTSLHITISHIQRQARLLRQQVESIERIDRAMLEVAQLQLIRQMMVELVRHIQNLSGENRGAGVTSVRQMMAGTRISDSNPSYDPLTTESPSFPSPQPSTSTDAASTSTGESTNNQPRMRNSSRKTYPPSRFFRLQRQSRRASLVHFISRRYLNRNERGRERVGDSIPLRLPTPRSTSDAGTQQSFSFSVINSSSLSIMTRRLERLLTEQMRLFTRQQDFSLPPNRSSPTFDLGEHILALRLHGCALRMNRVLGNNSESNIIRNLRADPTAAVTQDGVSRIGARHALSLILDGMSRHMEELGSSNMSENMLLQIHGVLAMSLLLCELLLLQVVDSIPPPSGMNLDPERETLTSRIDQMCEQMLQNRFSGHSHQLTRSLRLMRLTMRHAHRALGQTYNARRNAMLPRPDTDRRQLLGSINRCLRTISHRRPNSNGSQTLEEDSSSSHVPVEDSLNDSTSLRELYATLTELISRYSNSNREDDNTPSLDNEARDDHPSNDHNSSDNDEDLEYESGEYAHRNVNLYRTNNVNLVPNNTSASNNTTNNSSNNNTNQSRTWNVPSVHINDVPISEPSIFAYRLRTQRQRFAERVSELRSIPNIGIYRPRFLHPLYASINPFDADLDDPQREQIYDSDMITTVTPNHRIQAWDISNWCVPAINNPSKNIVVNECKIHNDASVDVARDGTILVTLLPSGGYLNVTNRLGVYSLKWETLGQCLYTTNFDQNAVSVSLSPLSSHLVVGLASRRVSIVPNDRWVMARIFRIDQKDEPGDRLPLVRELEQCRDNRINCIRWLPTSGQGLIYATNTGQLVILT